MLVIIVVVATSMGEEGKPPATTATSPPGTSPAETTPAETSTSETSPPETAPPAPFESATLYEFARYLFDANECFVPEPGEFPVSEIIPDKERIKCDSNDLPYTGTFWCHSDREGLRADREVYLGFAVAGTDPVLPPPAGQRSPADGIQVAFNHTGSNQGRVYWDSPRRLCAGELQAEHEDVGATIDFWLAGRDG